MKTKIKIKSIFGKLLFEFEKENNTIKQTLEEAIKQSANLTYADLRYTDLTYADLRYTDLTYANLRYADLTYADLTYADLTYADLRYANLRYTDLRYTDLRYTDLRYTDLRYANLRYTDLKKIYPLFQIVPSEGSFIAWKKASNNHLIKLEIPAGAKRHNSLGGRKCRCEFAKVLDIRNSKEHKAKECHGQHDHNTVYKIGETVHPDSYDPNPLKECSNGIHFFLTKEEAKDW